MKKTVTDAFEQVKMPDSCVQEIEEKLADRENNRGLCTAAPVEAANHGWLYGLAACLVLLLGLTGVLCPGTEPQLSDAPATETTDAAETTAPVACEKNYFFEDSGITVQQGVNKNGEGYGSVEGPAGMIPTWLQEADGRLYFVCNGETIDITDRISMDEPFTYSYTDPKGIMHCMAVGRLDDAPFVSIEESVGWAIWYRNMIEAEAEGALRWDGWISGSSRGQWCNALDAEYGWHEKAQREFDVPWS